MSSYEVFVTITHCLATVDSLCHSALISATMAVPVISDEKKSMSLFVWSLAVKHAESTERTLMKFGIQTGLDPTRNIFCRATCVPRDIGRCRATSDDIPATLWKLFLVAQSDETTL
uniref:SFRICE_032250 n=1 Tax=Spodoptera frugiperda TaxID=7108 RepID=A0A2H1WRV0_SPOFR